MSTTIPVPSHTFPNGDTTLHDASLPAGIHTATLSLDVSSINKAAGQSLTFVISVNDGVNIRTYSASFDGPWTDKLGALHNTSSLTIDFGSTFDINDIETPIVSTAAWSMKAVITAANGPIATTGGSLVLSA